MINERRFDTALWTQLRKLRSNAGANLRSQAGIADEELDRVATRIRKRSQAIGDAFEVSLFVVSDDHHVIFALCEIHACKLGRLLRKKVRLALGHVAWESQTIEFVAAEVDHASRSMLDVPTLDHVFEELFPLGFRMAARRDDRQTLGRFFARCPGGKNVPEATFEFTIGAFGFGFFEVL